MRIELTTSSLPRMRSTPELPRHFHFKLQIQKFNITEPERQLLTLNCFERETGFKPATLSLEG
jgi:hypothetical protein